MSAILGSGFPYYSLPFGVTNWAVLVAINCLDTSDKSSPKIWSPRGFLPPFRPVERCHVPRAVEGLASRPGVRTVERKWVGHPPYLVVVVVVC